MSSSVGAGATALAASVGRAAPQRAETRRGRRQRRVHRARHREAPLRDRVRVRDHDRSRPQARKSPQPVEAAVDHHLAPPVAEEQRAVRRADAFAPRSRPRVPRKPSLTRLADLDCPQRRRRSGRRCAPRGCAPEPRKKRASAGTGSRSRPSPATPSSGVRILLRPLQRHARQNLLVFLLVACPDAWALDD